MDGTRSTYHVWSLLLCIRRLWVRVWLRLCCMVVVGRRIVCSVLKKNPYTPFLNSLGTCDAPTKEPIIILDGLRQENFLFLNSTIFPFQLSLGYFEWILGHPYLPFRRTYRRWCSSWYPKVWLLTLWGIWTRSRYLWCVSDHRIAYELLPNPDHWNLSHQHVYAYTDTTNTDKNRHR